LQYVLQGYRKISSKQYKRLSGVKREVFEQMLTVLNETKAGLRKHLSRGVPGKLTNGDKLLLLLMYTSYSKDTGRCRPDKPENSVYRL
jgi:hypothetical protein